MLTGPPRPPRHPDDQLGRPFTLAMNTEIATTSACGQLRSVWPPLHGHQGHLLTLDAVRRFYAEEIAAAATAELPPALVEALARVPRERFLGPGPWRIMRDASRPGVAAYRRTPDADPRHLYHNVLVAIDAERQLNNGQPSGNAIWIAAVEVRPGDRVVHIGAGVGYYTAILAELTGSSGSVTAIEIDAALAERARQNLADHPWVTVLCGDGSAIPEADAIYVNAGCTHPCAEWLAALSDGGRLVLPADHRPHARRHRRARLRAAAP